MLDKRKKKIISNIKTKKKIAHSWKYFGRFFIKYNKLPYGLNYSFLKLLLNHLGYNVAFRKLILKMLISSSELKYNRLSKYLKNNKDYFGNNLIKRLSINYKYRTSLIMYNYKGMRLIKGLPVRGQRTRTNKKTAKKKMFYRAIHLNLIKKKR